MKVEHDIEATCINLIGGAPTHAGHGREAALAEARLPFTIRIAHDEETLDRVVRMRYAAYARHVPEFAERLRAPEPCDREDGVVLLLAESKLDGSALGTMRIQTNRRRPLAIEQSIELPDGLRDRRLAGATRLGVSLGRIGRVVKVMLFKAFYLYCQEAQIDSIVIAARAPLDRHYEALLFEDVLEGGGFTPLRHACNIPHRIMAFDIATAEARWAEARHPLLELFCRTLHPDIDVSLEEFDYRNAQPLPRARTRVPASA